MYRSTLFAASDRVNFQCSFEVYVWEVLRLELRAFVQENHNIYSNTCIFLNFTILWGRELTDDWQLWWEDEPKPAKLPEVPFIPISSRRLGGQSFQRSERGGNHCCRVDRHFKSSWGWLLIWQPPSPQVIRTDFHNTKVSSLKIFSYFFIHETRPWFYPFYWHLRLPIICVLT